MTYTGIDIRKAIISLGLNPNEYDLNALLDYFNEGSKDLNTLTSIIDNFLI